MKKRHINLILILNLFTCLAGNTESLAFNGYPIFVYGPQNYGFHNPIFQGQNDIKTQYATSFSYNQPLLNGNILPIAPPVPQFQFVPTSFVHTNVPTFAGNSPIHLLPTDYNSNNYQYSPTPPKPVFYVLLKDGSSANKQISRLLRVPQQDISKLYLLKNNKVNRGKVKNEIQQKFDIEKLFQKASKAEKNEEFGSKSKTKQKSSISFAESVNSLL